MQYALIGTMIGSFLFFGFFAFDYFDATAQGKQTSFDLRIENAILQQHLDRAALRAAAMEMQIKHLHKQNFALHVNAAQSNDVEMRLFSLIKPSGIPDSLPPSLDAALSTRRFHQ